jgi:hypothetical protein
VPCSRFRGISWFFVTPRCKCVVETLAYNTLLLFYNLLITKSRYSWKRLRLNTYSKPRCPKTLERLERFNPKAEGISFKVIPPSSDFSFPSRGSYYELRPSILLSSRLVRFSLF